MSRRMKPSCSRVSSLTGPDVGSHRATARPSSIGRGNTGFVALSFRSTCTKSNLRWVWSGLWSSHVENAVREPRMHLSSGSIKRCATPEALRHRRATARLITRRSRVQVPPPLLGKPCKFRAFFVSAKIGSPNFCPTLPELRLVLSDTRRNGALQAALALESNPLK